MEQFRTLYGDDLIYIFPKKHLIHSGHECLVVIRDGCQVQEVSDCLTMHYSENFESLVCCPLPGKNRLRKQIISLWQCGEIMERVPFGVLSFSNGVLPYSVGLDHILVGDRIFFHCSKTGYKLTGIGQQAVYLVVEDLGVSEEFSTHNHNSVAVFGTLRQVTDLETKKTALKQLCTRLSPKHPVTDEMAVNTNILELEVDYVNGKSHIVKE